MSLLRSGSHTTLPRASAKADADVLFWAMQKIEEKLYSDAATDSAYIEEYDSKCGSGVIGWTSFGRFY